MRPLSPSLLSPSDFRGSRQRRPEAVCSDSCNEQSANRGCGKGRANTSRRRGRPDGSSSAVSACWSKERRSATNENRQRAERQYLGCFAAEQQLREAPAPMRGHNDEVAAIILGRSKYAFRWKLISTCTVLNERSIFLAVSVTAERIRAALFAAVLSYSACGSARTISPGPPLPKTSSR